MTRRMKATCAVSAVAVVGLAIWAGSCVSQPGVNARAPEVVSVHAEPARLEGNVRKLCVEFAPRGYRQVANLDRVAAYLRAELEKAGASVVEQPFVVDGRTYRNVLAHFGPPFDSRSRVVVGAHYDAANDLPAADDNASGVAGLLELARLLGAMPKTSLRSPIELVAYTLEEPPYFATDDMGSVRHARSLRAEGARVRAMISLEMIGYFSDAKDSQSFPVGTGPAMHLMYPSTGNFITIVGNTEMTSLVREVKGAMKGASDLPVESLNGPSIVQGVDWSDHRSYWAQGYPAVMVTDTSFLRNHRYHTADDVPDTLDYVRMAKVVDGVLQAVLALLAGILILVGR